MDLSVPSGGADASLNIYRTKKEAATPFSSCSLINRFLGFASTRFIPIPLHNEGGGEKGGVENRCFGR